MAEAVVGLEDVMRPGCAEFVRLGPCNWPLTLYSGITLTTDTQTMESGRCDLAPEMAICPQSTAVLTAPEMADRSCLCASNTALGDCTICVTNGVDLGAPGVVVLSRERIRP